MDMAALIVQWLGYQPSKLVTRVRPSVSARYACGATVRSASVFFLGIARAPVLLFFLARVLQHHGADSAAAAPPAPPPRSARRPTTQGPGVKGLFYTWPMRLPSPRRRPSPASATVLVFVCGRHGRQKSHLARGGVAVGRHQGLVSCAGPGR